MQVKLTEEFFRKRSYTHRYDHLIDVKWAVLSNCHKNTYTIWYQDIQEEVTREEIVFIPR